MCWAERKEFHLNLSLSSHLTPGHLDSLIHMYRTMTHRLDAIGVLRATDLTVDVIEQGVYGWLCSYRPLPPFGGHHAEP